MRQLLLYVVCTHQLRGQERLVVIRQRLLHRQHHAVGYDGEQHRVLERRPLNQELGGPEVGEGGVIERAPLSAEPPPVSPPDQVGLAEDEEGGGTLLLFVHLSLLGHCYCELGRPEVTDRHSWTDARFRRSAAG